ncbi:MAG: hypothetical protein E7650_06705 [Ruminococcaceae bacterium]|nr:hypothetical protein [Oscillospiraceae bacterium]
MAENEKLTCPICGEATYMVYGKYPRKDKLCGTHSRKFMQKEIEQCPDCGKWHNVGEECECKRQSSSPELLEEPAQEEGTKIVIINEENKSRCITCGKKTDGLLFCGSCYKKYHNKELLFRIKGCSSVELLDEDYEGRFTCKDGHVVKSKSEREIDNYLFEKGIPHAYEKELPYGKTKKETLHPDFYLPHYLGKDKHVYIEHWGYDDNNRDYTKTKKFKMPIYEKLGITLICTYEKNDTNDIEATLDRKLNKENIDENTINYK